MNKNIEIASQFIELTDGELQAINGGQHMMIEGGYTPDYPYYTWPEFWWK